MDVKIKETWLEALRSGKYKQTHGKLKARNGAFCCLGILCEIQGAKWEWDGKFYNINGCAAMPPEIYEAGLINAGELSEMNDGIGINEHSFAKIADYIEANL